MDIESRWRRLVERRGPRVAPPPPPAPVAPETPIPAAVDHAPGEHIEPRECALVVLGCQPDLLGSVAPGAAAESLIMKTNAAIDILRLYGGHIAFVRIAFDGLDRKLMPDTNKEFSGLVRQGLFENGTPGADIHPGLAVQEGDMVVRTTRLGPFVSTDFDEQLTNRGITTLIIAGAETSGAVLSTVREAADRDYRIVVLSDCCADPDPQNHELLVTRLFPRQADITTAARLYNSLVATRLDRQRAASPGADVRA
ncbi:cysteine hydrolase [Mycolicibacterium sp.]|uniref:cysteine hydrolase n=1 Tax=Mycolicibacterium sp. TaxID=2320850 RepID=UPI003D142BF0